MTRLHTILAATDLSAAARLACERAVRLASACDARLELQHVVNTGALDSLRLLFASQPDDLQQRLLDEAREELRSLLAELHDGLSGSANLHLGIGNVVNEITLQADALDADLLVLGAHGSSLVRDLIVGSTTERVLRRTGRPLLVVRRPAPRGYRQVLIPVDFSARSLKAIEVARRLAPKAALVLLHTFEVPFEGRLRHAGVSEQELAALRASAQREGETRMAELIARAGLPAAALHSLVLYGDPSVQILEHERLQGSELIVIGKRGQNSLEDLLLGSVTKHILSQAQSDVLVI
ncbi:universal stress protein [Geopseudomonas guangdongensis]|uniref:Nucleotide-binding universal stress protein, UspA family n=1 Tax=Geopseudomonas guangdongensis TaxID=1245526 RepID=A0A1H2F5Y4_9GAMM|nr:universal stress protein [Pseudomonas guangdongensis]SDU02771.1 Nucleotide-binding universal stress protein, UspA family [Pseudomonas guangdongensis]